jgi:hypothetical protein
MDHRNPLHWTAADQTWNYQCADCHSTDLQKRYDAEQQVYDTRYAEINVACEACHGPGARHVEWAKAHAAGQSSGTAAATDAAGRGLLVDLKDRDGGVWQIDPETGKPVRSVTRSPRGGPHVQIETCARCHSRRGRIKDELDPGEPLHQGFRLALLEPALYFPDGQIKDEVFVFGSFIQSRMYHQGVVCGDCHEPHSLELHAEGNAVCARCHMPARYDAPEHHRHEAGSDRCRLRGLSHAPALLHGGRRARRSQPAGAPARSIPQARHPQCLQRLSSGQGCGLGGDAVEPGIRIRRTAGPTSARRCTRRPLDAPDATERLLALAADPHSRPSPGPLPWPAP